MKFTLMIKVIVSVLIVSQACLTSASERIVEGEKVYPLLMTWMFWLPVVPWQAEQPVPLQTTGPLYWSLSLAPIWATTSAPIENYGSSQVKSRKRISPGGYLMETAPDPHEGQGAPG